MTDLREAMYFSLCGKDSMKHTIHYICKYTPIELMAGMNTDCRYISSMPETFGRSEVTLGSNICGFGKSLMDLVYEGQIRELILTGCCDTIRSVFDHLRLEEHLDFLYFLDIPHEADGCARQRLARQLVKLTKTYEEYSGEKFSRYAFMKALNVSAAINVNPPGPYIALMGGRAGRDLHMEAAGIMPLPVQNRTCVSGRNMGKAMPDPSLSFEELMDWYAGELLAQTPCMRMEDVTGRRRLVCDPNLRGIIYHTIRFCDFYNFEYSYLKDHAQVPLVKIETDYTKSAEGQMRTRLEAFAEEIRQTYADTPEIFAARSRFLRKSNTEETGRMGKNMNKPDSTDKNTGHYFAGIDSGSTSTDAVILDENRRMIAGVILPTGAGAAGSSERALEKALEKAGLHREDIAMVVSTGYGRAAIRESDQSITEISCHAKGAHFLNPSVRTVIDIGGQDSKVIEIDEEGHVTNFVMNDKCAAGTGRFLEMMARTLEMSLEELSHHGLTHRENITISSTCTVFAESEVVSLIAQNKDADDIVWALDKSVAGKTAALAARVGAKEPYMMTGGVARNEGLVRALEEKLNTRLLISDDAQLCGALGAALYAWEKCRQ